jgi:hypothetical protein
MWKHPKVFGNLYISMVKSVRWVADTTLLKLAAMLEREVHLRGKIKSAMTCPVAGSALLDRMRCFSWCRIRASGQLSGTAAGTER